MPVELGISDLRFPGENLLKKVLPQTPFPNFELGLESARMRHSRPRTKFRRGVRGETLFKGVPPQSMSIAYSRYPVFT